jgi:hypothetical protein
MALARVERLAYPELPLRSGPHRWQRLWLELIVCWRAGLLDGELAAGANPADSPLLAIRARRITSPRNRARVADGLARAIRDARAATPGFGAAVQPNRREIVAARTVLAHVDRRLRDARPVTPRGVALLQSLLTDGTSPLYRPGEPGALGSELRAAAAALAPARQETRR